MKARGGSGEFGKVQTWRDQESQKLTRVNFYLSRLDIKITESANKWHDSGKKIDLWLRSYKITVVPATKDVHPIKRVRDSLKETSEISGLQRHASSKGFAEWIGRSSSLIRNVECGFTKKWDRLAKLIEEKTGVSSDWLLSSPAPTDPILDVDGKVWNAGERLDPYHGGEWQPNWNKLLMTSPKSVPRLIGRMVEAQVELDLGEEKREFLGRVISLLMEFKSFSSENFRNMAADALRAETPFMMNEIWSFMGHSNEAPDRSVSEFQAAGGDSIEKSARKARRR